VTLGPIDRPSRATGVVGLLLVDHAGDHRLPDVVVGRVGQTQIAEELVSQLQHSDGGGVRLRAGLETGKCALIRELMLSAVISLTSVVDSRLAGLFATKSRVAS
jgi:hypothetical protein